MKKKCSGIVKQRSVEKKRSDPTTATETSDVTVIATTTTSQTNPTSRMSR